MIRAALVFLLLLPAVANACETLTYKSNDYTLCEVTLDDDLRLFHSDADGKLLGSFSRINAMLADHGQTLGFAMNAGMYHADRRPVGLFIERGKEIAPLADGGTYGNFGLKPNGVFCFSKQALAVIETNVFRLSKTACEYATQSGPMLVIDGALHPRFLIDATSRYIRNGVGVSADGTRAYFVISDNPVTFHEFGSLFRDHLKTPNALYFDGKVSRLYAPDLGRSDSGFPLGVIVGTVISR
ncbi:phosphodiester glycosidase family protein [Profundibacter sp.]|uniref:phosphodiester glycosidase family protein n=1 Tax=Profundibacter sp. TaxID=3101071 RepID=UPI003D0F827A